VEILNVMLTGAHPRKQSKYTNSPSVDGTGAALAQCLRVPGLPG